METLPPQLQNCTAYIPCLTALLKQLNNLNSSITPSTPTEVTCSFPFQIEFLYFGYTLDQQGFTMAMFLTFIGIVILLGLCAAAAELIPEAIHKAQHKRLWT
jgi:hypothetical protein